MTAVLGIVAAENGWSSTFRLRRIPLCLRHRLGHRSSHPFSPKLLFHLVLFSLTGFQPPPHILTPALLSTVSRFPHFTFLLYSPAYRETDQSLRFCVPQASLRLLTDFRAEDLQILSGGGVSLIALLPACPFLSCLQTPWPLEANWLNCPALSPQIFHFRFCQHSQGFQHLSRSSF